MKLITLKKNKTELEFNKFNQIKNKILILRDSGGYGDILNMRMIFEDLKNKYPEFEFDWALPHGYFPAAAQHPYVKNLIPHNQINFENYLAVYNLTYSCTKYEWSKKKQTDKNRADIWAEYMGSKLLNHNMFMPNYKENYTKIIEILKSKGWDGHKKLVCFTPHSAIGAKNLLFFQMKSVQEMTQEFFLIGHHNVPILELNQLQIPQICNLNLQESMSLINFCNLIVSTDTGHLHCAGGYGIPTLGIFSYTSGYEICKYYSKCIVVQKYNANNIEDCGPCFNYNNCPRTTDTIKPCLEEISPEMIKKGWKKLLDSYK